MQNAKESLEILFTEKLKGIPALFGIRLGEEPQYEVLASEYQREVRRYDALTLASVTVNGTFEEARNEAFLRLADYIFHNNQADSPIMPLSNIPTEESHETLAMTVPVFQQKSRKGWTLSFVLPRRYSLKSAPRPQDSGITIEQMPARLVASIRYGGVNNIEKIEEHTEELRTWIAANNAFRAAGEPLCAQYDGPHTIPFLRRNEVHIPVQVRH